MAWEYWLVVASATVGLVGSVWLMRVGFNTSLGWGGALLVSFLSGLLVILLPLLGLIFPLIWLLMAIAFSVRYWRYAKMPALVILVGIVAQTAGVYVLGANNKEALGTMVQQLRSGEMDRAGLRQFIFSEFIEPGFRAPKRAQREPIKLPEAVEEQALDQMEAQQVEDTAVTASHEKPRASAATVDEAVKSEAGGPEPESEQKPEQQQAEKADAVLAEPAAPQEDEPRVKPDPLQIDLPGAPAPITRPVALSRAHNYMNAYFIVEEKNGVRHEGRLRAIEDGRFLFERKVYNGVFSFQLPQTSIKLLRMRLDVPEEPS